MKCSEGFEKWISKEYVKKIIKLSKIWTPQDVAVLNDVYLGETRQ